MSGGSSWVLVLQRSTSFYLHLHRAYLKILLIISTGNPALVAVQGDVRAVYLCLRLFKYLRVFDNKAHCTRLLLYFDMVRLL
jgi:hypothetical protein